jgi:hypothetical protein
VRGGLGRRMRFPVASLVAELLQSAAPAVVVPAASVSAKAALSLPRPESSGEAEVGSVGRGGMPEVGSVGRGGMPDQSADVARSKANAAGEQAAAKASSRGQG